MDCPNCGTVVSLKARYCQNCGSSLAIKCQSCGQSSVDGAKSCPNCGTLLGEPDTAPSARKHVAKTSGGGERRQLTILFCDLVGSTSLATTLDPEDYREVIDKFHDFVFKIASQHQGYIAQYLGDGALIYFGYPAAREDDAERAVRAGLEIVSKVSEIGDSEQPLAARIGIASGMTVISDLGAGATRELAASGETPNLAARLQAIAEPGAVVISPMVSNLVGNLFELRKLGIFELKGFSKPVGAFQALFERRAESRFEALRSPGSLFLGRDSEIGILQSCWTAAIAGKGRTVFLSGEPGIGKSRLVRVFQDKLGHAGHVELRFSCSERLISTSLGPVIDRIELLAGFVRVDQATQKLVKLQRFLEPANGSPEALEVLANLLSIEIDAKEKSQQDFANQKRFIIDFLTSLLVRRTDAPILMIWEDVHWIDPTSRELFDHLIAIAPGLPILIVATARAEFQYDNTNYAQVEKIQLQRIDIEQITALIKSVAGKSVPSAVVSQIAARTDGVPLFVEELTKSLIDSGHLKEGTDSFVLTAPLVNLDVPATLQGSLNSRIDRLGGDRELLQLSAAIGRDFNIDILSEISGAAEADLEGVMTRLIGAGLIVPSDDSSSSFAFKHALIQDAAYSSLVRGKRRQIHGRIARAIERLSPQIVVSRPELVAQHYEKAGETFAAVRWYGTATNHSLRRYAASEASAQAEAGIALVAALPDDDNRRTCEMSLQLARARAASLLQGEFSATAGSAFARARDLSTALHDDQMLLQSLDGLCVYHFSRRELTETIAVSETIVELGQRSQNRQIAISGLRAFGSASFLLGAFDVAQEKFYELLKLYKPNEDRHLAAKTRFDPKTTSLAYLSLCHLIGGRSAAAAETSRTSIEFARTLEQPASLTFALRVAAILNALTEHWDSVLKIATEILAFSRKYGFLMWEKEANFFQGWAMCNIDNDRAGLELMRRSLDELGRDVWPFFLAGLAVAEARGEYVSRGEELLDRAHFVSIQTGERWYEAELLRQKAVLRAKQDPFAAEELLLAARTIAEKQGAKLWEARANEALATLRRTDARPQTSFNH